MENEYLVSVLIDETISLGVNIFATSEDEAMDKADDNIRENNPQWEDSCIDILGCKLSPNNLEVI
jgi:hypothetical protein